jgi:predicted adenine nucleotide alpha hydrolase (AANH) superfamily ATPase
MEDEMKILLHMCCAPCSVYPLSALREEELDVEGLFYNPNIHPIEEFKRRKQTVEKFSQINNVPVAFMNDFKQDTWENFDGVDDERCNMCYSIRLDRAAAYAKERGYDAYTTSLLVSPYQKHELIKKLGEKFADKHGVKFYYRDFRPGFRQGQQKAREMGLYRQKFCGCIISYNESPFKNKV